MDSADLPVECRPVAAETGLRFRNLKIGPGGGASGQSGSPGERRRASGLSNLLVGGGGRGFHQVWEKEGGGYTVGLQEDL